MIIIGLLFVVALGLLIWGDGQEIKEAHEAQKQARGMSRSAALRDKIMEAVLDEKYDEPYQDGDDILITIYLGTVADDGELIAKGGDES